jgi:sirohydrochlorin ferrochelatase
MKTLILIAHGSRLAQSNDEVRELTAKLRDRNAGRYDRVECAFLELAEPPIPLAIDQAVIGGSSQVILLPYFLASGTHVSTHIPEIVALKQTQYPHVALELKPYVGAADSMLDLLTRLI